MAEMTRWFKLKMEAEWTNSQLRTFEEQAQRYSYEIMAARERGLERAIERKMAEYAELEPVPRSTKKITDVTFEWSPSHYVSVPTLGADAEPVFDGPRHVELRDQDGCELHPELAYEVLRAIKQDARLYEQRLKMILQEWNMGPEPTTMTPLPGHRRGCVYAGTSHWSCVCQPPTIFGMLHLYLCECCQLPLSENQFGLCATCQLHEYGSIERRESDHEAM